MRNSPVVRAQRLLNTFDPNHFAKMRLKPKFKPNLAPVPRGPRVRKVSESTTTGDAAAAARRIRHGYFHEIIFLQS